MEPVDPSAPPPEPGLVTRAVPAAELAHACGDGQPTAEQRARTARKHPPATANHVITFPYDVVDGMMEPIDF